jgi:hypothetical protein
VDPLADLGALSDDDLRASIRALEADARRVSFERKMLHGRIDILRAELVRRLQGRAEEETGETEA